MYLLLCGSYSFYQAANESTAKHHLRLNSKWLSGSQVYDKFDIYQLSDFKHIVFDNPHFWHDVFKDENYDKKFCERIIKTMQKAENITFKDDFYATRSGENWSCRNVLKYIAMNIESNDACVMNIINNIRCLSIKIRELCLYDDYNRDPYQNLNLARDNYNNALLQQQTTHICSLIKNSKNLSRFSIDFDYEIAKNGRRVYGSNKIFKKYCTIVNQFSKTILSNKVLVEQIEHLDFDDRYRYDYNHAISNSPNLSILHNIDKFINITKLKLRLTLPKVTDLDTFCPKLSIAKMNKLKNLKNISLIWYWVLESRSIELRGYWNLYDDTRFEIHKDVISKVIRYLFDLASNVKQFCISLPQLAANISDDCQYDKSESAQSVLSSVVEPLLICNDTKNNFSLDNEKMQLEIPIDQSFVNDIPKAFTYNGDSKYSLNLSQLSLIIELSNWDQFSDICGMIVDMSKCVGLQLKAIR